MRSWHENILVKQVQYPVAAADVTFTEPSVYIDMSDFERIVFEIKVGAISAGRTLDCQVVQATSSAGAGSKNISGAAITQLVNADDYAMATIEVRDTALDVANSFRYVALTTIAVGSIVVSITAYLYKGGGLPPTQDAFYVEAVEVS